MHGSSNATVESGGNDGPLAALGAVVKEAVAFAEGVPEEYRARVFDLAFERLSGGVATAPAAPPVTPVETGSAVTPIVTGGLAAVARELDVDPRLLARVVSVSDEGSLSIIGRVEARTNAEMQVQYSAVYCYIKERAFNQLDTPIEELRALCRLKSCYDMNNWSATYKKSGLLSPIGDGSKAKAYRLSNKGVEAAKELLKKMTES